MSWLISLIAVLPLALVVPEYFDTNEWPFWAITGAAFWLRAIGKIADAWEREE